MDANLFNCCTNGDAPDWSQYDALELGGCITHEEDGDSWTEGGLMAADAEFFTVYGHLKEGGCEAITDCPDLSTGEAIGTQLSALSGLQLSVNC